MKKYTTLYFDLDNTLLDFTAAEDNAVRKLLKLHNLPVNDDIVAVYSAINQSWWERFERGEIQKNEIFSGRFNDLLCKYGLSGNPQKMAEDYFEFLSLGFYTMHNADVVLEYLKKSGYTVCITTNGVSRTQYRRIDGCGLKKYFDYVIVSEDTGHQKPECEYFDYVMKNTPEKDKSKILVIGDSQSSDILGGVNFGVDTCWLNPKNKKNTYNSTYEIKNLDEIMHIL